MKKCLLLIVALASVGAFAVPALVKEASFWLDASTLAEPVGAKLERWADPRGAAYPVATSYMDCAPQVIEIAEGPLKGKRAVDFYKIHTRCDMQFAQEYRIKTAFFVVDLDSDWNAFLLCNNNGETEYPFARGTGGTYLYRDLRENGTVFWQDGFPVYDPHATKMPTGYQLFTWTRKAGGLVNCLTKDRSVIERRYGGKRLCEVIAFPRELNAVERVEIENYLRAKWFGGKGVYTDGSRRVHWTFPLLRHQQGLGFSDSVTGVMVWGRGDTLNVSLGRADLWDHRGGYHWTKEQSYTNIVDAIRKNDKARLLGLFRKTTPPGEPRNPTMMPLGRFVVKMPGVVLLRGTVDPYTGLGEVVVSHQGEEKTIALAMGKTSRAFSLQFPAGVAFSAEPYAALEFPGAQRAYGALKFKPAVKRAWDGARAGFTWEFPADPAVTIDCFAKGRELAVRTARGSHTEGGFVPYETIRAESLAQWRAFWKEGAHVTVPDPICQHLFDYGMFRFGSITDPEGVPPGLQGGFLEDDSYIYWCGDYHFNINVQDIFSPAYRGGHPKNLLPLFRMIKGWWPTLRENARLFCGVEDGFTLPHSVDDRGVCIGGFWTGTIDHGSTAWVAQMMFDYARYFGDREFLVTDAYPFMKGAMKVYRAMMEEVDGRLSLPTGPSPEWGGASFEKSVGVNPSFQLAAAHRLARNLISAAKMLGETPDPMWLDVEKRLPLASFDEKGGISIFEGKPQNESHRHHSHLAGLYPFDVFDLSDPDTAERVKTSFATWKQQGPRNWTGWCVPWASAIYTHGGYPDDAVEMLHAWKTYFSNCGHASLCAFKRPGFATMGHYRLDRAGHQVAREEMVMDGSGAACTAIMEMMVHEVNDKVEFFRGCPAAWKDVSFENIRLSDGRRVSGRRLNGKVTIEYK